MSTRRFFRFSPIAACALLLGACSPSLDWREIRPAGADMVLTLPCKPQHLTRPVVLAGVTRAMTMTGCASHGTTFVLGHTEVADAQLVDTALAQLRQAALDNLHGSVLASHAAMVEHATPGLGGAQELDIEGKGSDGTALREHLLLFAQGRTVYQGLVLGPANGFQDDAARTFSASIRLSPKLGH